MTEFDISLKTLEPKKTRAKKRVGRPSLIRENIARAKDGLAPIVNPSKGRIYKKKSTAILPERKKARNQEILAEMLGRKGQHVVQKVLDKALNDDDDDQMACLKLVMDRIIPADYMSKAKGLGNKIEISITGVGQAIVTETIDAEYEVEDV